MPRSYRRRRQVETLTSFQLTANEKHERRMFQALTGKCAQCDHDLVDGSCPRPDACREEYIAMFGEEP